MNGNYEAQTSDTPSVPFSQLSDRELYSLYTDSCWSRMSTDDKVGLLQETANRETFGYGYGVKVNIDDLEPGVYGVQNGREITLSRSAVENGAFLVDYKGKVAEYKLQDSNWQCLETVLHETRHSWQDEVAKGNIEADEALKDTFAANGFTVSDIDGEKGVQYMYGQKDFDLYLLNPTEVDANNYAQEKTKEIINEMRNEGAIDLTMDAYEENLSKKGYDVKLQEIREKSGKEDIDRQVAQVLKNCHFKTDEPVDAEIEKAVKEEMKATYQELQKQGSLTDAKAHSENIMNEKEQNEGVSDNNPEDFNGDTPSLDTQGSTGVLDNEPGDFNGDAPSVDFTAGAATSEDRSVSADVGPDSSEDSDSGEGSDDGGMEMD